MKLNLSVVAFVAASGIASVSAFQVGSSFGLKTAPREAGAPYVVAISSGKTYARNGVVLQERKASDKLADATKDISQSIEDAFTPDKYDDFNDAENDLKSGYPEVIYPDKKWVWDRADPKPRTENAEAGWLNVIELAHWATFPLGFLVAAYIFDNSKTISSGVVGGILNASPASVFLFILSVMCQCFGAGVSRGAMYAYSGWQAAPSRNPLKGPIANFMVDVTKNNDAWLRSVTYELTIGFQSIGLGLFTMAAYGISNWTKALVGVTTAIFLLGPKKPQMTWTHNDKHIIPLSKSLALAFGVNVVANLFANYKLFYPAMKSAWDGPTLGFIGSILSPVLIWAGGMIAGIKAETSYDQKWHLVAVAFVCGGISFSGNVWRQFVAFN